MRHGFILGFDQKPNFSPVELERQVRELIEKNVEISFLDDNHILIGDEPHHCTGPRMHMRSTGEISQLSLLPEFMEDPISGSFLLVGLVGRGGAQKISDLNNIML